MKARIQWLDNMTYTAEADSGHTIVIDGPADLGGRNLGVRPMELLLMGLGACSAVDVVHILKKSRQPVSDCYVDVVAERAGQAPKVFTRIELHFHVIGEGLSESKVARAITLSAEKYCSASVMLSQCVPIRHRFTIHTGTGIHNQ